MNLNSVVEDVKGRVGVLSTNGQKVAEISIDGLKQTRAIVVESIQTLVSDNTVAAKELFSAAVTGFEKAKTDGLKAVAADPIAYLPPADKLVTPFNHTVTIVTKTGDELYHVAKTSFTTIQAQLSGKPVVVAKAEKAVKSVKTGARKTVSKIKKAVK